ncbi:MAG TPA: tryptophan synthase subunit alpha [Acidimicrobiales bacterium]|nr:tryptophan synthase subunit alpha [Acidimicrobiales bacterium]
MSTGIGGGPPVRFLAGRLEVALAARRDAGHKLLVPYVTGGMDDQWLLTVEALAGAGADAIEVGIPFSDPMIDGPTIQEASLRALGRGCTPDGILADLSRVDVGIPVVVMTYYNLVYRAGHARMAGLMAGSGVAGAIIPDLPLEELGPWAEAADEAGVATVLLVAPSTPPERVRAVCARSRGFVYAVGRMGVTGEQVELADSARRVAERIVEATTLPVCVGIGISSPEQAVEACRSADGVVVGSAVVRRLLEGSGPEGAAAFVSSIRQALDSA